MMSIIKKFLINSFLLALTLTFTSQFTSGQKRKIKITDLGKWPTVSDEVLLSNNGRFVVYGLNDHVTGATSYFFKDIKTGCDEKLGQDGLGAFSMDSRHYYYQSNDSLYDHCFGNSKKLLQTQVRKFDHIKTKYNDWLIIFKKVAGDNCEILPLRFGRKLLLNGCIQLLKLDSNKGLLIKTKSRDGSVNVIKFVGDEKLDTLHVWTCNEKISELIQGNEGKSFAALVKSPNDNQTLWVYSNHSYLIRNIDTKIDMLHGPNKLSLVLKGFSGDGKFFFLETFKQQDTLQANNPKDKIKIWSFFDKKLPPELSEQPLLVSGYAIDCDNGKIAKVYDNSNRMLLEPRKLFGNTCVIEENEGLEEWWPNSTFHYFLVDLRTGEKSILTEGKKRVYNCWYAPNGKYLIYYDRFIKTYLSLNLLTQKISAIIDNRYELANKDGLPMNSDIPVDEISAWDKHEEWVIINSLFDIYKVSLSGKFEPICLSNKYGKKNQIKFRLISKGNLDLDNKKSPLILSAYNSFNKQNGFYMLPQSCDEDPKKLFMGPYSIYKTPSQTSWIIDVLSSNFKPLKAENRNVWIIKRESASEYPNLFWTRDLVHYRPITNLHPEKSVLWLKSELHTIPFREKQKLQGVLYIPENLDSTRKYPIILNYYERRSQRLFDFPYPDFSTDNINIAWFVSQGYLVFTPDIYYEWGNKSQINVGEWAKMSVESFIKHLSDLPFVDTTKIGIQGHSFGGMETAYIATHSNKIAAAMEAAGSTDPISRYLTLIPFMKDEEHLSPQGGIEHGHEVFGATPWQNLNLYLSNSSVLSADKIRCPILMMHNPKDNQVQWRQGVEFFMALRRLNKRVWMLEYPSSGHTVNLDDAKDYTIRTTQFFDHYLKGAPAPLWMTRGITAEITNIEARYRLDTQVEP